MEMFRHIGKPKRAKDVVDCCLQTLNIDAVFLTVTLKIDRDAFGDVFGEPPAWISGLLRRVE